jgi:hypothetical protein
VIRINGKSLDVAKSGLFMAFGSATCDGETVRMEVIDDHLNLAAMMALNYLAREVFGEEVEFLIEDFGK